MPWAVPAETVAGETTPAANVKVQYVWDLRHIDAPVLRWRDTGGDPDLDETLYFCQDANMNVTALVDGTTGSGTFGAVVERVQYDPYGKPKFSDGSWTLTQLDEEPAGTLSAYANEILFCGYRLASYAGVYDVRNRMYHPTLGRWLQRDPIGYVDATNLYGYVRSDPVGRRDPRGLEAIKEDTFGYRALTWDDFTPGTIEGSAWASIATSFDEDLGELDRVTRVCVDDRFCSGAKPSPSTKCYQCFTSWKKCTRLRAVTDPTHSVKDLSKEKLGGAVPPWVSWTRN